MFTADVSIEIRKPFLTHLALRALRLRLVREDELGNEQAARVRDAIVLQLCASARLEGSVRHGFTAF